MLGSESVRSEVGGIFAGKDGVGSMVAVDAFLWDDDDVDDLVEEGKLKRFTCSACRSSEHVHEVEFISHSLSIDEMIYLFKGLLPSLQPPNFSYPYRLSFIYDSKSLYKNLFLSWDF